MTSRSSVIAYSAYKIETYFVPLAFIPLHVQSRYATYNVINTTRSLTSFYNNSLSSRHDKRKSEMYFQSSRNGSCAIILSQINKTPSLSPINCIEKQAKQRVMFHTASSAKDVLAIDIRRTPEIINSKQCSDLF